jgi:hypothetical protein
MDALGAELRANVGERHEFHRRTQCIPDRTAE